MYRVYCIRDKDRVLYVGATKSTLARRRWSKYAFPILPEYRWELLVEVDNEEQMWELEKFYIEHFDTVRNGLNQSTDGKWATTGVKQSAEWVEKRIAHKRGKATPTATKELMSKNSPLKKPVICLETGITFDSAREAAKIMGLDFKKISLVCKGKRHTTGGYSFAFVVTMGSRSATNG